MKNMEKINELSENPCACLCQCVCALLWLPFGIVYNLLKMSFVIVYNLLKPIFNVLKYVYHLICCVSSKDGDSYGGGIAEEVAFTRKFDRPLQFV